MDYCLSAPVRSISEKFQNQYTGEMPRHDGKATYFQILARMSPLPVANNSPWGLGATEMTGQWTCISNILNPLRTDIVPEFL